MIRLALLLFGLGALPAPAQAVAQSIPTSPDVIVEGKIPESQRLVCKQTIATGSIIPTRTCKTKADWERIRDRNIAQLDQLERDQVQQRFTNTSRENCADQPVLRC